MKLSTEPVRGLRPWMLVLPEGHLIEFSQVTALARVHLQRATETAAARS
jgi:hypothetical protein